MHALNKKQQLAVDSIEGPVLIIAGPGTGKTTVLTHRIANILQKTDTKPEAILALTYTNSGVISMKQKLFDLIGADAYRVNIYTIHSFCNNLIDEYPDYFSDLTESSQIANLQQYQIITQLLDSGNYPSFKTLSSRYHYVKDIVSTIANLKREYVTPQVLKEYISQQEEVLNSIDKHSKTAKDGLTTKYKDQLKLVNKLKDLHKIYINYNKYLKDNGFYDFEDMINFVLTKLKTDEIFLKTLQERFLYFLIDEFQDSNSGQNQIIYELAKYWGDNANVFAVGDDDQSIYRFQGASVANMHEFIERYKNADIIVLTENYRSTQNILDASFNLIKNNKTGLGEQLSLDKRLHANTKNENTPIIVGEFSSALAEYLFIVEKIRELHDKQNVNYSDIAILTRTNGNMDPIIDLLQKYKIPYIRKGGENVLKNIYITQLLDLITVIGGLDEKPDDDALLFKVMHYDFLGLNALTLLKLARKISNINKSISTKENQLNLWDYLYYVQGTDSNKNEQNNGQNVGRLPLNLDDEFKQILEFFKKLSDWYRISKNQPFARFFETVISESGFIDYILQTPGKFEHINALNSLFEDIKALNRNDPDMQVTDFLKYLDLIQTFNIPIKVKSFLVKQGGVQILTAHSSKGLEFDYVFIPQLYEQNWEKRRDMSKIKLPGLIDSNLDNKKINQKIEEERRLLYVAMTRAKKQVFLTYSLKYQNSIGHEREVHPSQFVSEIPENLIKKIDTAPFDRLITDNIKTLFATSKYKSIYISTISDKDYILSILKTYKLSPTDLNLFLEDPDEFYLRVILKTPYLESVSLVFGDAFHKAVRDLYYEYAKTSMILPFDKFFNTFLKRVQKAILSKEDKLNIIEKGKILLKNYYETKALKILDSPKPIYLEKPIGNVRLSGAKLKGIIDKVVPVSATSKDVVLVDYKTGNYVSLDKADVFYVPAKKDAKMVASFPDPKAIASKYKRQLLFYKILADLSPAFIIAGYRASFGELEFISKKDGSVKTTRIEYKPSEVEDMKQLILDVWDKIHNFKF